MSDITRKALVYAVNELNEISAQVLYLAVSVAHTWDDRPGDGLACILTGLHDRITATSARLSEALEATHREEQAHD